MSPRKDLLKIEINDKAYLLVFHKYLDIGFGSAVSLYINNFEFLKFDCFGKDKGHYHIYHGNKCETIYFTEETCEEQITKSAYELTSNINFYLKKSKHVNIQNFKFDIDNDKLLEHIENMKIKMIEYESRFYSKLR